MGLHPAERVREYRAKGYWNDDMIDALLRERVAQFGDITAITDPLNREALLDGLRAHRHTVEELYDAREYGKAVREVMLLADRVNEFVDQHKPWELAKNLR